MCTSRDGSLLLVSSTFLSNPSTRPIWPDISFNLHTSPDDSLIQAENLLAMDRWPCRCSHCSDILLSWLRGDIISISTAGQVKSPPAEANTSARRTTVKTVRVSQVYEERDGFSNRTSSAARSYSQSLASSSSSSSSSSSPSRQPRYSSRSSGSSGQHDSQYNAWDRDPVRLDPEPPRREQSRRARKYDSWGWDPARYSVPTPPQPPLSSMQRSRSVSGTYYSRARDPVWSYYDYKDYYGY